MSHNIIDVKEAEKFYCPMGRSRESYSHRCIGDNCMAWKWSHDTVVVPSSMHPGSCNFVKKDSKTHGYCGMVVYNV